MADSLKGFKIPRLSERPAYYRSDSIEIFDYDLPEKVSFHVFALHVCTNAAELQRGRPLHFLGSINGLLLSHVKVVNVAV